MQRTLCRIFRNSCSRLRENEKSPVLATEDLHQKSEKEKCNPPSPDYTFGDAIGWTSLVISNEFIHRRRRKFGQAQNYTNDFCSMSLRCYTSWWTNYLKYCPFGFGRFGAGQPVIGIGIPSTARSIQAFSNQSSSTSSSPSSSPLSKSIDTTPFLRENDSTFFPSTIRFNRSLILQTNETDDEDDDGGIQFDASITKFDEAKSTKPADSLVVYFTEKLIGDIYSALGSFKLLQNARSDQPGNLPQASSVHLAGNNPDVHDACGILVNPMELLEKGAVLGSGRALYNIGVAYDRLNEHSLAGEYYQRAADIGHPLAAFNLGVMLLKDGKILEGLRQMKYAAENGVMEASEVLKLSNKKHSHETQKVRENVSLL